MEILLSEEGMAELKRDIEANYIGRALRRVADAMDEEVMNAVFESGMKTKKFSFVPQSLPYVSDCYEVIAGEKKKSAGFVYYSLKNGRKGSAYAEVFFKQNSSKKPVPVVLLIRRRGQIFERYDMNFKRWIPVSADESEIRHNILELEKKIKKDREKNGDVKYAEAAGLINGLDAKEQKNKKN